MKTGESELLEFDLAQPEMGAIIETANTLEFKNKETQMYPTTYQKE